MNYLYVILYIFLAPVVGGIIAGIDRKLSAKMQGRVGPPLLQPFYDVVKLFSKEIVVVNRAEQFFVMFFFIFMVFTGALFFGGGDILLTIFAFTLTSIFLVVAAYSTNSPYSTIGAERELLQMMAYEPMVLFMAIGIYQSTGTFNVNEIVSGSTAPIVFLPGIFLGFVYILTIKLRKSPFDISTSHHGHQEIVKGITTEFAGPILGIVEIAHWYENVLLLGMVSIFFRWDSPWSIFISIGVCAIIYFVEILIDNASSRVKWNLLLKSSWLVAGTLGFINILILSIL